MVYHREGNKETFLTRAHAMGLEVTSLTFADVKSTRKQLREKSKNISNHSILAEIERRDQDVAKTVKDRRKKAQAEFSPKTQTFITEAKDIAGSEDTEDITSSLLEPITPVKIWDLDEDY